ncbi:hypothetical protein ACHAXR_006173 [Thalassiosira sp. AJA248-18]
MSDKCVNGKMRLKSRSQLPAPSALIEVKKDGTITLEPSHISIPQPDGTMAPIPTVDVATATEMLGVFFAPVGNGAPHITDMREKGVKWAGRLEVQLLPICDIWLSFFLQLYPGMAYGLASSVLKPAKLGELIQALYYKILPLVGVNRCITKAWRMLPE